MATRTPEKYQYRQTPEEVLGGLEHIPVALLRDTIREEIRKHNTFVLIGETGSGKTTCLPPLLLELRNELKLKGNIAVTQPRRVATRSVTARVSDMLGCDVGEGVGYNIRFENITQPNTDITFMTDGILLRKIQFDPYLSEFSIVMVDEAHERSLNIDLCLGLLKGVNERRIYEGMDPIFIVITSATIERNKFAQYIGAGDTENSLEIPGKMFPVQVFYEEEARRGYDFIQGAGNKVKEIVESTSEGDILIFMPGKREISETIENIRLQIGESTAEIIALHSELSPEDQDRIFSTSKKRKIIVSTNIAETSVTIDGIIHVIDTGLIKQTQFDPMTGIEQLVLVNHALSGIEQRKGRAGRTAPGFCHRLFTEESLKQRLPYQTPEIQRSNLSQVVLAMKKVGIKDILGFDFIDLPDRYSVAQAEHILHLLGALDKNENLTQIGEIMVELGLEPRLGRMVIEAAKTDLNCVNEICIIASFLDGKNVFVRPVEEDLQLEADRIHKRFTKEKDSDFVVILNVWKAYVKSGYDSEWAKKNYFNEKTLEEAKNVRLELLDVLEKRGIYLDPEAIPKIDNEAVGKAITAGLIGNLIRYSKRYGFVKFDGKKSHIKVHPGSIFFNRSFKEGDLLVADEVFINPNGKAYACNCLEVKREWLEEVAPEIADALPENKRRNNSRSRGRSHKSNSRTVYNQHSFKRNK